MTVASVTRTLRLNPWTTQDVRAGKEPGHFDFTEPDDFEPLVNKAGTLFIRMTPDHWGACGAPETITVSITGTDTIEEDNQ